MARKCIFVKINLGREIFPFLLAVLQISFLLCVCRLCWKVSGHPLIREDAFDGPSSGTFFWLWHSSGNQSNAGKRAILLAQNKVCVL